MIQRSNQYGNIVYISKFIEFWYHCIIIKKFNKDTPLSRARSLNILLKNFFDRVIFYYNARSFFQYFVILHLYHIYVTRYSRFTKVSIACMMYSCLKSLYCIDVKILSLSCFEYKHPILFFLNFSILFRFCIDLILKFLNYDHIPLLRDIFKNDLYEKLFSSVLNFSFENEIISLNLFFTDRKDLIETQHVEDAKRRRTHDSKK